ncbi:MAG: RHS repeat-associated core domain-containing protein [Opitutaceae bacterium]|nr:RHS repeat-associated core domain-containing protein [Opitutaceae bacterium]
MEPGLESGTLYCREMEASPAVFTPAVMFYLHPLAWELGTISKPGNVELGIFTDNGSPTKFVIPQGTQIGSPVESRVASKQRVALLDSSRALLTASASVAPAFVRVIDEDGGMLELDTTTKRAVRYVAANGRITLLSALPESLALRVIRVDESLRQIKAVQGLVDFISKGENGFELRFYTPSAVGAFDAAKGIYTTTGPSYRTIFFENPNAAIKRYDRLKITDTYGTRQRIAIFDYNDTLKSWSLLQGGGSDLRRETKSSNPGPAAGQTTYTTTLRDGENRLISTKVEVWQENLPWGREKISETVEPNSLNLLTTWNYGYQTPGAPGYGRLQYTVRPDGSWESFTYDNHGRVLTHSMPWKNSDYAAGTTSARRIVQYDYTSLDPADVVETTDQRARTTTESVIQVDGDPSIVTKRDFYVRKVDANGRLNEITERATVNTANYASSSNLRIVRVFGTSDTTKPDYSAVSAGRLLFEDREDGTRTSYTYTENLAVPAEAYSQSEVMATPANPAGIDGLSERTERVFDIRGNLVILRNFVRAAGNWVAAELHTFTVSELDRTTADFLNGRQTAERTYDAEFLVSERTEDGVETRYTYDQLGRQVMSTKMGVPSFGAYSEQPSVSTLLTRALGSTDCGCDGEVLTTTTSGSITLESFIRKDSIGRMSLSRDENGLETSFHYALGGRRTTRTDPDLGTEISESMKDGRPESLTGSGTISRYFLYGVNSDGSQWSETRTLSATGVRWEKTTVDLAGRTVATERPAFGGGTLRVSFFYDTLGRTIRNRTVHVAAGTGTETAIESDQLYTYDVMGNVHRAGQDINGNGTLDLASSDRISETQRNFEFISGSWWRTTKQVVYPTTSSATAVIVGETRQRLDGLSGTLASETVSIDIHGNQSTGTRNVDYAAKVVTDSSSRPGSTVVATRKTYNGLLVAMNSTGVAAENVMGYDPVGRMVSRKDPRHGSTSKMTYFPGKNQVASETDAAGHTTSFEYYPNGVSGAGKLRSKANAVGQTSRYAYDLLDRLVYTWGTSEYPISYTYDSFGAMASLSTWRDTGSANLNAVSWPSLSGADITSWVYDGATGLLTRKQYSTGSGTDYEYSQANRLFRRIWTRTVSSVRVATEYGYDANTGELTSVNYSDSTPDVTSTYDRLGRVATVTDVSGTRTFAYNATTLQPTTETLASAYFGSRILTHVYQGSGVGLVPGRSGGYKLGTSGLPGQDLDVTLAFDTSGRLSGVNSGAGSFSYGYVTNSELLSSLTGPQVATTYAYEPNRDVRTEVLNQIGTTTISRYGYRSDGIARRKDRVKEGTAFSAGVYDRFAYNDRNEVTLTRNYTGTNPDGASDPETVALARQFSYDAIGNRLTSQSGTSSVRGYTSNALNQYTALTNPSTSPVHDLDGNQTQSGTGWYYEWDAENRLALARDYATSPVNGSKKLEFTYDYQSRRIRKIESSYVSSAWTVLEDRKFIYEGWNLVGEFATSGFARICAYTWGLDLSQTHQGAGGVGGLLAVTTATPSTATFFATYDGNGNVSEYISSTGGIEAHFEYDAFGELSASTGSNLGRFGHRFSSKYWDSASSFYYYGFRYYNPQTGRWPSRDPIGERGGLNLYWMVGNSALNKIDLLGLEELPLIWDSIEVRKLSIADSVKISLVFRELYENLKDLGPLEVIDILNAVTEVKSSLDTILNANRIDRWPLVSSSMTKHYGNVKCFERVGFVVSAKGLEVEPDAVTGHEGTKIGSGKFISPLPTYLSATIRRRVYFIYQCTNRKRYTRAELMAMNSSQLDALARSQAEPKSIRSQFGM